MRRLLIDGPGNGKIVDWPKLEPMQYAEVRKLTCEEDLSVSFEVVEPEHARYWPFDIFDPGDEETGRAPGRLFVMVWEDSPRFNKYRGKPTKLLGSLP